MRIRTIKPEFWRSDDVDCLDWHTRLLFIGLWSYVDDNGVGRDRESDIAADLFAGDISRDPLGTLARVSEGLRALSQGGQIARYTVDGRPFLYITSWERHQKIDKPSKSRYPPPTSENAVPREDVASPSRGTRETLAPGTGEQGNRGTDKELSSIASTMDGSGDELLLLEPAVVLAPDPMELFDEFWRQYPRREAKQDAFKAWKQTTREVAPQAILVGLAEFHFSPDRQYIPMPATWLRARRWEDETTTVTVGRSSNGTHRPDGKLMPWEL